MPLPKRPVYGLDDINQRRRDREVTNQILDHSFDDYQKTTKEEKLAGITPINPAYPPSDVRRYGAVGDGVTDDTAACQAALDVAGINGGVIRFPYGLTFLCTANLNVPVGDGFTVDIEGAGWACGGIQFSGAAVTTGLTFDGDTDYEYGGSVRNIRIRSTGGALRGITYRLINHPLVDRCRIRCDDGAAVAFISTLMAVLRETLITSSGSATEPSVLVDRDDSDPTLSSTTFKWDHSRISGGDTTVGGLVINRTGHVTMLGGAIESCGICLRVGMDSDDTYGSVTGVAIGVDFENPGTGNPFVELGAGLSSTAFVSSWLFDGCNASPSGSTTVTHFIQATRTRNLTVRGGNYSIPNGTSMFEFEGTENVGAVIEPHRHLFSASGVPWVRVNNTQVMAAGASTRWYMQSMEPSTGYSVEKTITGTDPTVNVSDTQGGYHRRLLVNNGGATNMTTLTGSELSMEIFIRAGNGNTTLVHDTGTAHAFNLLTNANTTLASGKVYHFIRGATVWVQI